MTVEEKAKRYDEAIERANELNYVSDKDSLQRKTVEHIFPELAESKDERIRKKIIQLVNDAMATNALYKKEMLAWLEKQGEQPKKHDVCDNCDQQGSCVSPCPMKLIEKQGEQKVPDVAVVHKELNEHLKPQGEKKPAEEYNIIGIGSKNAQGKLGEMIKRKSEMEKQGEQKQKIQPKFKIGDIIRFKGNETLKGEAEAHKIVDYDNELYVFADGTTDLFCEQDLYELVEQKPVWSEEDEENLNWFDKFFRAESVIAGCRDIPQDRYLWFKNLKDRVHPQPKQEWKQENTGDLTDFENAMMHIGSSFFGQHAGLDPNDTNAIKEQANLLLELVPKQDLKGKLVLTPEAYERILKLNGQKPAWSEKDDEMLDSIIEEVRYIGDFPDYPTKEENELYDECLAKVEWLISLKERHTWKPSYEQMEALWSATEKYLESDDENVRKLRGEVLELLYEDLEKLRRE